MALVLFNPVPMRGVGWQCHKQQTGVATLCRYCREQLFSPAATGFLCVDPELESFEDEDDDEPAGSDPAGELDVGPNQVSATPTQVMEVLAWQVDYSDDNAFHTLVEAVDACARSCSCTGIVLAES